MKRIIAYSTLSQLGYMFVAAGLGAYWVALFHLAAHAFFKSVLFLGAGNVMHAMDDELDIRKMGALHNKMKATSIIMTIASLALAGIFPLAGFFSKDKILEVAKQTGVEAIHPGYGFLSENAEFCDLCEAQGIVFLGPNDPWDMFDATSKHWLTFKSAEWETQYRARIDSILSEARKHHVSVMWLTPPNMHKDQLNEQMIYLNQVIQSEVQKSNEFVIDSRPIVGGKNNHFTESMNTAEGNVKMRSADGIHFTVEGQKIIAHNILQYLHLTN